MHSPTHQSALAAPGRHRLRAEACGGGGGLGRGGLGHRGGRGGGALAPNLAPMTRDSASLWWIGGLGGEPQSPQEGF